MFQDASSSSIGALFFARRVDLVPHSSAQRPDDLDGRFALGAYTVPASSAVLQSLRFIPKETVQSVERSVWSAGVDRSIPFGLQQRHALDRTTFRYGRIVNLLKVSGKDRFIERLLFVRETLRICAMLTCVLVTFGRRTTGAQRFGQPRARSVAESSAAMKAAVITARDSGVSARSARSSGFSFALTGVGIQRHSITLPDRT